MAVTINVRQGDGAFGSESIQLVDFMEVLTVDQAVAKLRKVVAHAEASKRSAEMPWVRELRASAAAAAKAKTDAERKAEDARSPGRRTRSAASK